MNLLSAHKGRKRSREYNFIGRAQDSTKTGAGNTGQARSEVETY